MTIVEYKGTGDKVYLKGSLDVVHSTDETPTDDILNTILTDLGITDTHKVTANWDSDDSAFLLINTDVLPNYQIPVIGAVSYSSETQMGIMNRPYTSVSRSITGPKRAYMSAPTPPVVFTTGYNTDSRSENTKLWNRKGHAVVIKSTHRRYNSNEGRQDVITVITPFYIKWYCRRFNASGSWPMYASTYPDVTDSTSPINNYTMCTLYESGNTTEVTLSLGSVAPEGTWESNELTLQGLDKLVATELVYEATTPTDTSISLEIKVGDNDYVPIENGEEIPQLILEEELVDTIIKLRVKLLSSDSTVSPSITKLKVVATGYKEERFIELVIDPLKRFNNNEGNITVEYANTSGHIYGVGGFVESFRETFTPIGLEQKPNPSTSDKVTATMDATLDLLRVEYETIKASSDKVMGSVSDLSVILIDTTIINP